MAWWQFWRRGARESVGDTLQAVRLSLPGWTEAEQSGEMRAWHNAQGDVLALAVTDPSPLPDRDDALAVQCWCRGAAEASQGGLIEALVPADLPGAVGLIYKQSRGPAYLFTGMLLVPDGDVTRVWTVMSRERGPTGLREAIVTAESFEAGRLLTLEQYERDWVKDPYDPTYAGPDRRVMRFMSDDECYDERFPAHPLSIVRRVMSALPQAIRIEPAPGEEP